MEYDRWLALDHSELLPCLSMSTRLISSSETVAHQLESTNQLAEETARIQNATLRSQEQILRDGELLWQTLRDSSQGDLRTKLRYYSF